MERFDDDYCRCGIHDGVFYQTEDCKEAIDTMTVKEINGNDCRLRKALNKGFRIPYLTLSRDSFELYNNSNCKFDFDGTFGSPVTDSYSGLGKMKRSWMNPRFTNFYDTELGEIAVNLEYEQYDKKGLIKAKKEWMATYPMEFTVVHITEDKVPVVEAELSNSFSLLAFKPVEPSIINKIKVGEKQTFVVFGKRNLDYSEDFRKRSEKMIEVESKVFLEICDVVTEKVWIPEYQTTFFDTPARLSQTGGEFHRDINHHYFYVYKNVQFIVETINDVDMEVKYNQCCTFYFFDSHWKKRRSLFIKPATFGSYGLCFIQRTVSRCFDKSLFADR